MKIHFYMFGAFVLAASMVPAAALAEDTAAAVGASDSATAAVSAEGAEAGTGAEVQAVTSVQARPLPQPPILQKGPAEVRARALLIERKQALASSSDVRKGDQATGTVRARAMVQERAAEQARERSRSALFLGLKSPTTSALSLEELKQVIEKRKQSIRENLASTSPREARVFERASRVSVAVHALLASRDLLGGGGIGQQVSDIARQVDDSLASTTVAETQIESRGFFAKMLFGGDKKAADEIRQQVEQNRSKVQDLAQLLSQASATDEVKATLEAQITAMQEEHSRLEGLAQKEKKQWGFFSWRF